MYKHAIITGIIITMLSAVIVRAEFSEDFSDPATSNTRWIPSIEKVTLQFTNGSCTVNNSDKTYVGIASYTFKNDKPSLFTLSGKITLGGGDMAAGFVCCLSTSGAATGYYISFRGDGSVNVDKMAASGNGEILVRQRSAYLTPGANELKVSKKDNKFTIFCNGHCAASFTDNTFASGDIAMLVSPSTTAVFDDIRLTDVFEECTLPTCFTDDFSDNKLLGWSTFGDAGASIRVDAGALRITTVGQNVYKVIDLPLDQFVMKAVVSHRGGSTQKVYGLFICGDATDTSIPLAGFSINGKSNYAAFLPEKGYTLATSSSIKGDAYVSGTGDTTYYKDTLEVIKREGSADYLFIVNTDTLTRFTGVTFAVTGAGVFCLDSLDVTFDDFVVAEGASGTCPVRQAVRSQLPGDRIWAGGIIDVRSARLFDLSGRLVRGGVPGKNFAVPGLYLRRNADRPLHVIRNR